MNNEQGNEMTFVEELRNVPDRTKRIIYTRQFQVELVIITMGMFIAAIGVYFFLILSRLIIGSITGLSLVPAKLLPFVSVGTMIFIINAILLVFSFLLIGNELGVETMYAALILRSMIDLIDSIVPIYESLFTTYVTGQAVVNPWFNPLCFVFILSASRNVLLSINASTGEPDILAEIFNKYLRIKFGTAMIVAGGAICCTAFAINPTSLMIIGLARIWLNGLTPSHFVSDINSKTRVHIISEGYQKIVGFVVYTIRHGVTLHEAIDDYANGQQIQLEVILTKGEFPTLIDFVSKGRLKILITSDTVSKVYGLWNKRGLLRTGNY